MEEQTQAAAEPVKSSGGLGCGPILAVIIIILIVLVIGGNFVMGAYFENCFEDENPAECIFSMAEEPEEEGTVAATGDYTYEGHSVTVTANIPLDGGNVTGSISGTCDGKLKGNFDGQNNGVITGNITGACSPFVINVPASAEFSGTVNKDGKVVLIGFTGRGPGITHEGQMSLSY